MIKKHTGDISTFLNSATIEAARASTGNNYEVTMIDAHKIYVNEKNLYGIRGIEEMANSMAISDNIPPLVVVPVENGKYKLISGERRLSAVLLREQRGEIENPKVPCFIREIQPIGPLSAEQSEMFLLILENAHRDKTPLEKLNEIKAMEPIARIIYEEENKKGNVNGKFRSFFAESILNISEASLKRLKALDRLIPEAKDALEDGHISQTAAVELSKKSEAEQTEYMERLNRGEVQGTLPDFQPPETPLPEPDNSEPTIEEKAGAEATLWDTDSDEEEQEDQPDDEIAATDDDTDTNPEEQKLCTVSRSDGENNHASLPNGEPTLENHVVPEDNSCNKNDEDFAWGKVESNIADELRELIATFQHNARQTDNADIEIQNNRVAAVYDILHLEYLDLAIAVARAHERHSARPSKE